MSETFHLFPTSMIQGIFLPHSADWPFRLNEVGKKRKHHLGFGGLVLESDTVLY